MMLHEVSGLSVIKLFCPDSKIFTKFHRSCSSCSCLNPCNSPSCRKKTSVRNANCPNKIPSLFYLKKKKRNLTKSLNNTRDIFFYICINLRVLSDFLILIKLKSLISYIILHMYLFVCLSFSSFMCQSDDRSS